MPKVILTEQVLNELADKVFIGQMNKLKIARYKSGAKAGQLFAEYSLRTEPIALGDTDTGRKLTAQFLQKASHVMAQGTLKEIYVLKTDVDKEIYVRSMETSK